MVSCRVLGCINWAVQNSNIINISYNNDIVIITISPHIHNSGIFNGQGIFETLANI